jgi:phosphate transport system permease protein
VEQQAQQAAPRLDPDFDRLNRDWYIDKAVQLLVFLGGISAIVFIIGIFVFITKEGFGFLVGDFDFREFFFSPNWRPTSEVAKPSASWR